MPSASLALAINAARHAGKAIMGFYQTNVAVEHKGDGSPLTHADQTAHRVIVDMLRISAYPVVSEEGDNLLMDAKEYWLVDPLDGTKDFLAGNGEFTVNIALVVNQRPVLGVVFAPALDELYAGEGNTAWCVVKGRETQAQQIGRHAGLRMAVSRFHDHPDVDVFAAKNTVSDRVAMGSALKYGRLAMADVDVFPRLVGSSEWDTAAGQAVLEAVGGEVLVWSTGEPLRYGKPWRRNPGLLSLRAPYRVDEFELMHYEMELS